MQEVWHAHYRQRYSSRRRDLWKTDHSRRIPTLCRPKEEAFRDRKAQFVVYGTSHHHEVVPLNSFPGALRPTNQMYINSGTWHTYYDLAINKPEEQKFIPYQVLTYLSFYKDDERQGRCFETWSESFSD
ncbi:MAG: hypothetical protein Q8N46_08915 [Anaerolineales bacterium]|nr:hypothetical protein [Anaerolineales bacterium]